MNKKTSAKLKRKNTTNFEKQTFCKKIQEKSDEEDSQELENSTSPPRVDLNKVSPHLNAKFVKMIAERTKTDP